MADFDFYNTPLNKWVNCSCFWEVIPFIKSTYSKLTNTSLDYKYDKSTYQAYPWLLRKDIRISQLPVKDQINILEKMGYFILYYRYWNRFYFLPKHLKLTINDILMYRKLELKKIADNFFNIYRMRRNKPYSIKKIIRVWQKFIKFGIVSIEDYNAWLDKIEVKELAYKYAL